MSKLQCVTLLQILTQCAELSQFAVYNFFNNLIYGQKLTALRNFTPSERHLPASQQRL